VAYDEKKIDVWSRTGERWSLSSSPQGSSAMLEGIGCRLGVEDVYRDPLSD
jgi:hypothetical protein